MRRKLSTLLDEALYRRAKLEAALRGKQVSEILGEALEKYFEDQGVPGRALGVVGERWNSIGLPPAEVMEIMAEEADEDWF